MALYKNITASGQVKVGNGQVSGFIVNSHTSGTLKLWDSLSASGVVIIDTYTFPAGSSIVDFPWIKENQIEFQTGLYATIGGTANITIVYK